jgi:hypothetical protein
VLRDESGLDLDREIAEEERRANDRLAIGTVAKHGTNQHSGGLRITNSSTETRSYIVACLHREARHPG